MLDFVQWCGPTEPSMKKLVSDERAIAVSLVVEKIVLHHHVAPHWSAMHRLGEALVSPSPHPPSSHV